jgi:HD superfamily phosphodiesterase
MLSDEGQQLIYDKIDKWQSQDLTLDCQHRFVFLATLGYIQLNPVRDRINQNRLPKEETNMSSLPMAEMIATFGNDQKRIDHAVKVYGYATAISELESLDPETREIIAITAILHDIGIKECERKFNTSAWKCQESEGPPVARQILEKLHINEDIIERVCFIIGHHHSFEYIDGIDFQVLVEADFLVNASEDCVDKDTAMNFAKKYFKTASGKKIIEKMYEGK